MYTFIMLCSELKLYCPLLSNSFYNKSNLKHLFQLIQIIYKFQYLIYLDKKRLKRKVRPWLNSLTSRMSYDVTSVRPLSLLSTATFAIFISVKTVLGDISLINPRITAYCHLKCEELLLSVQTIPQNIPPCTVNNVTF